MKKAMRSMIWLLLASSFILHPSAFLRADGGTVRVSEQTAGYRITVFTSPTPVRVGPVDLSVLVQDAATGEVVSEGQVGIQVVPVSSSGVAFHGPATHEAATNKLYYAATFTLPEPGRYAVEVSVDGVRGTAQARLELDAAEPLPSWLALWPWVGWPVLAILLFSLHQLLVRKRSAGAAEGTVAVRTGPAHSLRRHRPLGPPA